MSSNYEFARQTFKRKAILYGLRALTITLMLFFMYVLAWGTDRSVSSLVNSAGGLFILIWIYTNLLRVRVEVQEIFVPPFNTLNGVEFMLIGVTCFILGVFLQG